LPRHVCIETTGVRATWLLQALTELMTTSEIPQKQNAIYLIIDFSYRDFPLLASRVSSQGRTARSTSSAHLTAAGHAGILTREMSSLKLELSYTSALLSLRAAFPRLASDQSLTCADMCHDAATTADRMRRCVKNPRDVSEASMLFPEPLSGSACAERLDARTSRAWLLYLTCKGCRG
jgi:hypothetical protein